MASRTLSVSMGPGPLDIKLFQGTPSAGKPGTPAATTEQLQMKDDARGLSLAAQPAGQEYEPPRSLILLI